MMQCRGYLIIICLTTVTFVSCKKSSDTGTTTTTVTTPGVVDNNNGMYVRLQDNAKYSYAIHESSGFASSCTVTSTSVNKDIVCYVEAKELDLFDNGVDLVFNVPSSLCSYVNWYPYFYYDLQPGVGPTAVTYDIDANNNKVNVVIAPVGTAALSNNEIVCTYDYRKDGNPNCCEGNYTLTTRTWNASIPGYDPAVAGPAKWDGNGHECLAGPGFDSQEKTKDMFPTSQIYLVEGSGINFAYNIKAPIDTISQKQVYAANYYNPADHGGSKPAALLSPNAIYFGTPQDTYELQCLDRSFEFQARIRVQIREWNTTAQYNLGAVGNPDLGGNEAAPWAAFLNNDFRDWLDYLNTYPGR